MAMGTPVVASLTNGPLDKTTMKAPVFASGTPQDGPSGWAAAWAATLQDYRYLGPIPRGMCNVVMADGSVKSVRDLDRDGLLNSGFSPNGTNGFDTDKLELPGNEFGIRWSLRQPEP
jgi:prepilin-type processing-associated H-X9-DG protein